MTAATRAWKTRARKKVDMSIYDSEAYKRESVLMRRIAEAHPDTSGSDLNEPDITSRDELGHELYALRVAQVHVLERQIWQGNNSAKTEFNHFARALGLDRYCY
jgi:hypothetical protein